MKRGFLPRRFVRVPMYGKSVSSIFVQYKSRISVQYKHYHHYFTSLQIYIEYIYINIEQQINKRKYNHNTAPLTLSNNLSSIPLNLPHSISTLDHHSTILIHNRPKTPCTLNPFTSTGGVRGGEEEGVHRLTPNRFGRSSQCVYQCKFESVCVRAFVFFGAWAGSEGGLVEICAHYYVGLFVLINFSFIVNSHNHDNGSKNDNNNDKDDNHSFSLARGLVVRGDLQRFVLITIYKYLCRLFLVFLLIVAIIMIMITRMIIRTVIKMIDNHSFVLPFSLARCLIVRGDLQRFVFIIMQYYLC